MDQSSSRDDLVNTTVDECLADDVCPVDEFLDKVVVRNFDRTGHFVENLFLDRDRWILLLTGDRITLEECLVEDVSSDKATIVRSLPFRVCGSNHGEPMSRSDILTSLLDEISTAFEDGLETHDLRRVGEVDLVAEQDSTTFHRGDDWTLEELGLAIHESETTDQIILVGLNSEVDTDNFAFGGGTCLLDHVGLAITRQTSNEDRVEHLGFDDITHGFEVAEWDKHVVLGRYQVGSESVTGHRQ